MTNTMRIDAIRKEGALLPRSAGLEWIAEDNSSEQRQALVSSHFFFRDGDFTVVAHINRHGILFLNTEAGRNADAKRDARLTPGPKEIGNEKCLELAIATELTHRGIPFQRQKRCTWGIMDIFIEGEPPAIIEVKDSTDRKTISEAIGQLVLYGSDYPSANLFVAVPGGLNARLVSILAQKGIGEWKS